jgi:hypothetical protein
MLTGFALAVITYIPVFHAIAIYKDNPVILTMLVWYMVILVTMVYGPIAAFLVEFFPARIRYSSMSLPYHVGNGVFGGGVPFVGLFYPMAVSALGVIVGLVGVREPTRQRKIWEEVGGQSPY